MKTPLSTLLALALTGVSAHRAMALAGIAAAIESHDRCQLGLSRPNEPQR